MIELFFALIMTIGVADEKDESENTWSVRAQKSWEERKDISRESSELLGVSYNRRRDDDLFIPPPIIFL